MNCWQSKSALGLLCLHLFKKGLNGLYFSASIISLAAAESSYLVSSYAVEGICTLVRSEQIPLKYINKLFITK